MIFILFGKWEGVRLLSLKIGRDAAKIKGQTPHINNSK
jgi:hypothetical protein